MAEIKWIKITTDIFDDEKIKLIDSMPDNDALIVIWFKLLTLAGKVNDNGYVYISQKMPVTDEMLATIFNRPLNTVRLALKTFSDFGMVEIENHISIVNWEKHQNVTGMEKIREQTRKRVLKHREKLLLQGKNNEENKCNVTGTLRNATEEIRIEQNRIDNKISYEKFVDAFHDSCNTLPRIAKLTDARKKALKRCVSEYGEEQVLKTFTLVGQSSFLTGKTGTWSANIDWILKPANMVKILEGSYADKNNAPVNRPPYNPNPENLKFL